MSKRALVTIMLRLTALRARRWYRVSSMTARTLSSGRDKRTDVIVPGTRHEYGSLGERPLPSRPAAAWQAEHNVDVQRVTQKAIVYELTQQSSSTLESVVPWFLEVRVLFSDPVGLCV